MSFECGYGQAQIRISGPVSPRAWLSAALASIRQYCPSQPLGIGHGAAVELAGQHLAQPLAAGHFFDGQATCVVGTHTHVPTADTRILEKGTAYQTDIGMCGDYNSVIGMNKENSIKRFLKNKDAVKHFPAVGEGTLSGIIVETDTKTGLAKSVFRIIDGGSLAK